MGRCTLEQAMQSRDVAKKPEDRKVFGSGGKTNYLVCPSLCPTCKHLVCEYTNYPIICEGRTGSSASHQLHGSAEIRDSCAAYEQKSASEASTSKESSGSILDGLMPSNDLGSKVAKGLLKGTGKGIKKLWDLL